MGNMELSAALPFALIMLVIALHRQIIWVAKLVPAVVRWILRILLPIAAIMGQPILYFSLTRRLVDRAAARIADYLVAQAMAIEFGRRATAETYWPEAHYPELYTDVRPGLRRAPFDDGRLLGGAAIGMLVANLYSEPLLRASVRAALAAASAATFALAVMMSGQIIAQHIPISVAESADVNWRDRASDVPDRRQTAKPAPLREARTLEQWDDEAITESRSIGEYWYFACSWISYALSTIAGIGIRLLSGFVGLTSFFCSTFFLLTPAFASESINQVSGKWRVQTKDSLTRARLRADDLRISRSAFRQAIQTDNYIVAARGPELIQIGVASGQFAARGAIGSPLAGEQITIDLDSIFQNTVAFGGIGEGKTTAVLKVIFAQVLAVESCQFGAVALDAKGVLWRDLKRSAERVGRGGDVMVIGADDDMLGVDALAGLRPADFAAACRTVMGGGDNEDAFFADLAAVLLHHAATVAFAVSCLENGGNNTYTLGYVYQLCLDDKILKTTLGLLANPDQTLFRAEFAGELESLRASLTYLGGAWLDMAQVTRTGIVANVSKILDPIFGNPALATKFSRANPDAVDTREAFRGKIILLSISAVEHGIAARLLLTLIKTSFYRAARLREIQIGSAACQKSPVLVVMDEAQELLSADSSGLSDGSFFNVSRSAGVAGLLGVQQFSALRQALGEASTDNLTQQFRNKIFLRTEDIVTHQYCCSLAGERRRALSYIEDTPECLEQLANAGVGFFSYEREAAMASTLADIFDPAKRLMATFRVILGGTTHTSATTIADQFSPNIVPWWGGGGDESERLNREERNRAEDQYREWLSSGNESAPLLTPADILSGGRYFAYAHVQRAGLAVQDIIAITHDFD